MSRYLYSNLIKIIFESLIFFIIVPSFICLIGLSIIDKQVNLTSLVLIISCIVLWVIVIVVVNVLNKTSKNKIIFEENKIQYKDRTFYTDTISIKYFKFYISVIEPSLVIPKIHINGNNLSVTCYLAKKDIKKLKKMNYEIKDI